LAGLGGFILGQLPATGKLKIRPGLRGRPLLAGETLKTATSASASLLVESFITTSCLSKGRFYTLPR
jgi:hypothetical protein